MVVLVDGFFFHLTFLEPRFETKYLSFYLLPFFLIFCGDGPQIRYFLFDFANFDSQINFVLPFVFIKRGVPFFDPVTWFRRTRINIFISHPIIQFYSNFFSNNL